MKFEITSKISDRGIWLPSSVTLKENDVKYVCKKIKNFFECRILVFNILVIADVGNYFQTVSKFVKKLKSKAKLIYFDEFQVTNIVDAMILGKLFDEIF